MTVFIVICPLLNVNVNIAESLISTLTRTNQQCFMKFSHRMVFCIKDPDAQKLTQELTFVKCNGPWRRNRKQTPKR